jgi:Rrf2 family protein
MGTRVARASRSTDRSALTGHNRMSIALPSNPAGMRPVIQVSRRVEYALRAVIFLARQPRGTLITFREIAEREAVPAEFLAKILRSLVAAEIVTSARGTTGGFALARPPEDINFLEVIEAAEGPIALNDCCAAGDGCDRIRSCAMQAVWARAEGAMRDVFRGTRIADLAASGATSVASPSP